MFRAIAILLLLVSPLFAEYRTANFVVVGASPEWQQAVGDAAEADRKELASFWFDEQLPNWQEPCRIEIQLAKHNGGNTSFTFQDGVAFGFDMRIKGTPARLIDSVVKHEVNHTVFATHFGQPVPRWADEGLCSLLEHDDERMNWEQSVVKILKSNRGIALDQLLAATEYPLDYEAFYAQGYSLCSWLIEIYGPKKTIAFVADGMRDRNWPRAMRDSFGFATPLDMQNAWIGWMKDTPGPMRFHVGQCGSCQSDWVFGGRCMNGSCQQRPPQVIYQPVRPTQPSPPQVPIQKPPQPQVTIEQYNQQNTKIENLIKICNQLTTEVGNAKPCNCDDACNSVKAELNQKIETLAVAINEIKNAPAAAPATPNYDEIAAEVGKRLQHSATITLLDGTKKTQTKPLSEPLDFNQHVRPQK